MIYHQKPLTSPVSQSVTLVCLSVYARLRPAWTRVAGLRSKPKVGGTDTEVKQTLPRAGCYRPVAGRAVVEQYNAPRGPPAGGVWTRRAGRRRGEANGVGRHPRRPLTSVARRNHGDASRAAGCARTQELQVVHGGADHRAPLTPPPRHPQRATRWPATDASASGTSEHRTVLVFS